MKMPIRKQLITAVTTMVLSVCGLLLIACGKAQAHRDSRYPAHRSPSKGPYTVSVEDADGNRLKVYRHRRQSFVLGQYNKRYQIRVSNRSNRRIEAVVSVDGRNVLDGKVANYRNQRGYIVEPYGSTVIEGFRQSFSQVASFRFTDPGDSYSSRRGTPQHVGVIGVAVFPERRRVQHRPMIPRKRSLREGGSAPASEADSASPSKGYRAQRSRAERKSGASSAGRGMGNMEDSSDLEASPTRRNNLGTRYGEDRYSPVRTVAFRRARATRPRTVLELRYDDADGLLARGISVYRPYRRYRHERPQAFPASYTFAPPPSSP